MTRPAGSVIRFLGWVALLSLGCGFVLVYRLISRDPSVPVDPALVGLIGGVTTVGTSALSALGAILATTGKGEPQPVRVENVPDSPVIVEEVP